MRLSRWVVVAIVALVLLVSGSAPSTRTQPTSAAWAASVGFTSPVSSGDWSSVPDPIVPGPGVSATWTWSKNQNAYSTIQVCAQITVTTTSPKAVNWTVEFNIAAPPWNGNSNLGQYYFSMSDGLKTALTNGVLQFGNVPGRNQVSSTQPYTVTICNDHLTPISSAASANYYTVSSTRGTWVQSKACVVTTVTGNGTQPFYFSWVAPLDMSAAIAYVKPTYMSRNDWNLTITPDLSPTTSSYTLSGGIPDALKGNGSVTVTVCAKK